MSDPNNAVEYNVYSTNFALCASIGKNQNKSAWVLNLLLSKRIPDDNKYDWSAGTRFQVTSRELSDFLACMTGDKKELKLERRQSELKKRMEVKRDEKDGNVILLSMRTCEANSAMMVRVEQADRLKLAAFAFNALMRNNGGLAQDVLFLLHSQIYNEVTEAL